MQKEGTAPLGKKFKLRSRRELDENFIELEEILTDEEIKTRVKDRIKKQEEIYWQRAKEGKLTPEWRKYMNKQLFGYKPEIGN